MSTLAGTFDVVAPSIPAALVSAPALERLRSVTAELPAALTNRVYVECRAADDAPQADLIISVNAQGRSLLLNDGKPRALGEHLRDAPAWGHVRALARAWNDPRQRLHRAIRRLWLEFDLDSDAAWRTSVEPPGVFVDFAAEVYAHPSPVARLAAATNALHTLGGPAESSIDALARCIAALPAGGCLMYIGVFPGRDAAMVRACVAGLSDDEVEPYLCAIGWTGSPDALHDMLAPLAANPDARGRAVTVLHLDLVGETVRSRLGAERALGRRGQVHGRIDDAELLDALVTAGVCSTVKRCAVEAWPGVAKLVMPHEFWPTVVARRVNHVKLVGGNGEAPRAKIYLCATHQYFDRRIAVDRCQTVPPVSPPKATRRSIR